MSQLPDPRPVFTIVMGCDGVGKSAWKRQNYDLLPSRYFDQASFAGGIGDWNNPEAHARARVYVDAQIAESIDQRLDFGTESTDSGQPGPGLVERVIKAGYRVEGVYFGTNDPQINIDRIEHRVFAGTGHMVDPKRIPESGGALCPTCAARRSDSTCFGSSTTPSTTRSTCPDLSSNASWSGEGLPGR